MSHLLWINDGVFEVILNGLGMHVFSILRGLLLSLCIFHFSIDAVVDNLVCKHTDNSDVYLWQVADFPQYKDNFLKYAKRYIHDETISLDGLEWLAYSYPTEMPSIIDNVIYHLKKRTISAIHIQQLHAIFSPYIAADQIARIENESKKIWPKPVKAKIDLAHVLQSGQDSIAKYISPSFLTYKHSLQSIHGTQTEQQFCKYMAKIIALLVQYKIKDEQPAVKKMLLNAFTKEVQEHKKGNYVFWHGRSYAWDYCAYVYKQLYNLNQLPANKVGDDYTFLRFDNSNTRWSDDSTQDALYMNAYLFGNIDCYGHSTIQLVLSNDDFSRRLLDKFTAEYICSLFNLDKYFTKYQADFNELKRLHEAAGTQVGNLLMISIDAKNIEHIYSAGDWVGQTVPITLSDGSETTEVKKIIADLKTGKLTEFDHLQCVMPLTKEYALHPKKGPRIYSFNATHEVNRKKFEDFGKKLFAKIEADIKAAK